MSGSVRIVVVAVPGAGKTTTLRKLERMLPEVTIVNFGDLMYEEAVRQFRIANRDEMRTKIGLDDYRLLQLHAARRIAEGGTGKGLVIIDTHAAIKTPFGYYPGLPAEVVRLMKPDAIVGLEHRPEDILNRRTKDKVGERGPVRQRAIESIEDIEEHQRVSRDFAVAAANQVSCYLRILRYLRQQDHPYQHSEEGARDLKELILFILRQKQAVPT